MDNRPAMKISINPADGESMEKNADVTLLITIEDIMTSKHADTYLGGYIFEPVLEIINDAWKKMYKKAKKAFKDKNKEEDK